MTKLERAIEVKKRPLFGAAVHGYNPVFIEIIGRLGYDVAWIEAEHMPTTYQQAADLCRIAAGVGLLTMIRIPDSRRDSVLKAAECGPDVIDLPMANSPEVLRELVTHARYAPIGNRGFFSSSRAICYGMDGDIAAAQRRINSDLCLIGQIETTEAVERAEELCGVPGVDGIFIGPGDLSTSLGVPGQVNHPTVVSSIERAVGVAKSKGKIIAMAGGRGKVAEWAAKGVQVFFLTGDTNLLQEAAHMVLRQAIDEVEGGGCGGNLT